MQSKSVTGMRRGCGVRELGGLYVCSGLSPFGSPIEDFIIDPPILYSGEPFRAPMVFNRDGKNHLMLYVGAEHYPYCSDFIEEVRRFGVSKRVPNNFQMEKLEPGSMLFLAHTKALIEDYSLLVLPEYCPKKKDSHLTSRQECCLGYSYQIAEPNKGTNERVIGDTTYTVYPHGISAVEHEFKTGIFLGVPITHFDHIMKDGNVDPEIAGQKTNLPLNFEED